MLKCDVTLHREDLQQLSDFGINMGGNLNPACPGRWSPRIVVHFGHHLIL